MYALNMQTSTCGAFGSDSINSFISMEPNPEIVSL